MDAPEDSAMYIHRVGRTARNQAAGHALLMLLPSEERPVTEQLAQSGVPVKRIAVNPKHRVSVSSHAAALLVSQPDTRSLAKKAFTSYLRSIQLLPFNSALDIRSLALDAFSASLGLAVTPELPLIERGEAGRELNRDRKNVNRSLDKLKRQIKEAKEAKRRAKEEAAGLSKRPTEQPADSDSDEGSGDDLLVPKGGPATAEVEQESAHDSSEVPVVPLSRKKLAKLRIRTDDASKPMRLAGSKRTVFDEAGEEVAPLSMHLGARPALDAEQVTKHARQVKARLDASRAEDDAEEQRRVRDLHRARRMRDRPEKDGADEGVQLGGDGGEEGHNYEDQDSDDNGSADDDESESEQEEQEEVVERSKKVNKKSSNKRQQVYTSDSDDEDEEGHNSDPSGADLARQEQLALELLGRR